MTDLTIAYITALTGTPDTVMDWRLIHDRDRANYPAFNLRGTYQELATTLQTYNAQFYGVFCNINALNGQGATLDHVSHIRTHVVDLDDLTTAAMNYDRAINSHPLPHFAVQSSPGKYHIYWLVDPYVSNDFYTLHQRKLTQLYGGDPSVCDATRVLRVPGFYHCKGEPHLITCWGVSNEPRYTFEQIQQALQYVNIVEHVNTRYPLGTPEMQAPSLEWLQYSLKFINPEELSYDEWRNITAAFKQSGWSYTDEATLYHIWNEWCGKYSKHGESENLTLWRSLRDTQLGWNYVLAKVPHIKAMLIFGDKQKETPQGSLNPAESIIDNNPNLQESQEFPEMLDCYDCEKYFNGCVLIEREGKIFTKEGRYLNSTQFNAKYGGKEFIITKAGKLTDEPWKAALRSTVYSIPKVDHVRFLPNEPSLGFLEDEMGRLGINTYIPIKINNSQEGDITMWLNHIAKLLPDQNDQKLWHEYLAHCIKYPGYKIQYSPVLQSAEGVGKSAFYDVMAHALGSMYVYRPKAQELISSGSRFNAWMRSKLMIIVDEIKIDERRELIEILKPMITDSRIEIQSKGVDQDMEDNVANWLFFSNYKDCIPINKNGRRYAIFYSALQSERDILNAGMDKKYFDQFWSWLREGGGLPAIAHYYKNYPIELGAIPVRAPRTSSYEEALRLSRSPIEVIIDDCVEDGVVGFRGGFVSSQAALNRARNIGVRNATLRTVQTVLEQIGYHEIGKTNSPIPQEDVNNRSIIYSRNNTDNVEDYMTSQGYR